MLPTVFVFTAKCILLAVTLIHAVTSLSVIIAVILCSAYLFVKNSCEQFLVDFCDCCIIAGELKWNYYVNVLHV